VSKLGDIRAEIAHVYRDAFQEFTAYDHVPGSADLPAVWVDTAERIDYQMSMGATIQVRQVITFAVSRADEEEAQKVLDDVLDPRGPLRSIERHKTTGIWQQVAVDQAGKPYPLDVGETTALAVDVLLDILA